MALGASPADASARASWRALWPALARGGAAALAVALAGGFASPIVAILAAAAGASFYSLARRGEREAAPPSHDRFAAIIQAAFLVTLCAAASDNRSAGGSLPVPGWPELVGGTSIATGVLLRRRAVAALGRHFTVKLTVTADHRLVTSGPYRLLRHPNYAALVLIMLGTALALRSPFALLATALLCVPAIVVRALQEERALAARLGPAYESYARRTWRLVPGVF